jgi:hypothetical protein
VLTRLDVDASSGTRGRAQETRGALHISVVIERETMTTAIASGISSSLVRILNSDTRSLIDLYAEELERMKPKVLKELSVGDGEAFEDLHNVDPLKK